MKNQLQEAQPSPGFDLDFHWHVRGELPLSKGDGRPPHPKKEKKKGSVRIGYGEISDTSELRPMQSSQAGHGLYMSIIWEVGLEDMRLRLIWTISSSPSLKNS